MKYQFTLPDYIKLIEKMAAEPLVRAAVLNSYIDNPWWPKKIEDWRMRMVVAGLSTRVGFRMLGSYIKVIDDLSEITFDDLKQTSDDKIISIIKPLGMSSGRLKYIKSMICFIESHALNPHQIDQDKWVKLIHKNVVGASYKVAACCVLYVQEYNCGIIPVDSGIKDTLAPCLGFAVRKTAEGHETARYQFEELSLLTDWSVVAHKTGYESLDLSNETLLSWWLHLVVINFKRYFCNNKKPENCPLLSLSDIRDKMGQTCSKEAPKLGGAQFVVVEAILSNKQKALVRNMAVYGFKPEKTSFKVDLINKNVRQVFENDLLVKQLGLCAVEKLVDLTIDTKAVAEYLKQIGQNKGRVVLLVENPEIQKIEGFLADYKKHCDVQIILSSDLTELEILKSVLSPSRGQILTPADKGIRYLG